MIVIVRRSNKILDLTMVTFQRGVVVSCGYNRKVIKKIGLSGRNSMRQTEKERGMRETNIIR